MCDTVHPALDTLLERPLGAALQELRSGAHLIT